MQVSGKIIAKSPDGSVEPDFDYSGYKVRLIYDVVLTDDHSASFFVAQNEKVHASPDDGQYSHEIFALRVRFKTNI